MTQRLKKVLKLYLWTIKLKISYIKERSVQRVSKLKYPLMFGFSSVSWLDLVCSTCTLLTYCCWAWCCWCSGWRRSCGGAGLQAWSPPPPPPPPPEPRSFSLDSGPPGVRITCQWHKGRLFENTEVVLNRTSIFWINWHWHPPTHPLKG